MVHVSVSRLYILCLFLTAYTSIYDYNNYKFTNIWCFNVRLSYRWHMGECAKKRGKKIHLDTGLFFNQILRCYFITEGVLQSYSHTDRAQTEAMPPLTHSEVVLLCFCVFTKHYIEGTPVLPFLLFAYWVWSTSLPSKVCCINKDLSQSGINLKTNLWRWQVWSCLWLV